MTKKKILIATGGTGGHIFPAISLAKYLISRNCTVQLTSDNRGLKYLKNHKNIKVILIPSSPLVKRNFFQFSISILLIFISFLKSLLIFILGRPSIVIGMGGYSSFPVCMAAAILRIKFIIYENNLIIGKANKYLLPFAKKIFVSRKEIEGIPENYRNKIVEVGNIIREEIINSNIFGKDKSTFENIKILVLGGSQAARIFAQELPPVFRRLKNSEIPFKVYQQCQKEQKNELYKIYEKEKIDFEIFNFTDKILDYYSKSSLVITRAGASVLGELINVKIPFISIPLPSSADNHQYKNAEFYKNKGCGYLLEERDIKVKLYDLIIQIFNDKSLIKKILLNQRQYSDKNIFKNLETEIEKIVNEKD